MKSESYLRLEQLEQDHDLSSRTLLGYPLWPSLRLIVHRGMMLDGDTRSALVAAGGWKRWLSRAFKAISSAATQPFKAGPDSITDRDIWILSTSNYRRRESERGTVCIYAEDLRKQLGDKVLFIEFNDANIRTPSADRICDIDGWGYWAAIIGLVACLPPVRYFITRRHDTDMFAPLSRSTLVKAAIYGRFMQSLARKWIRKHRPRAVFVICGYTTMIPIQRAVREAGIPLIELQHGLIHSSHSGYVFGDLPEQLHFPDRLVTFGRRFNELLETASPRWQGRLLTGGHPWLKSVVSSMDVTRSGRRHRVVAFGQYDPPVQRQLVEFMCGLAKLAANEIELSYKPHPQELNLEEIGSSLTAAGVQVLQPTADSYKLLAETGTAITVFSTIAMEALAFGCNSVVLTSPFRTDDIQELVNMGWIDSVDTPSQAVPLIGRTTAENTEAAKALFGLGSPALDYDALVSDLERNAQ